VSPYGAGLGVLLCGLIVEERATAWQLRYIFYGERDVGWVHVLVSAPLAERSSRASSSGFTRPDWHEREAEDLFGGRFEGIRIWAIFVLHNDAWQEALSRCATA